MFIRVIRWNQVHPNQDTIEIWDADKRSIVITRKDIKELIRQLRLFKDRRDLDRQTLID